jgi:solute carrier family 35 protein F5
MLQLLKNRSTKERGHPSTAEKKSELDPVHEFLDYRLSIKETASLSLQFCLLWFGSNYSYNYGLSNTSLTSSTVLSNTSSIFVYILGLFILSETHLNFQKAALVLLSFSGVLVITLTDKGGNDKTKNSLKGNLFTLLSAAFYGLYATMLKKKVPAEMEERFSFSLFLGMVGLFNFFVLLPMFFILHYTGIETFAWPSKDTWGILTANAILGTVLSDFCWAKSVVLMGPLITTLGLSLTIPLSMLWDTFNGDKEITWPYYIGTACIICAFLGLSYKNYLEEKALKNDLE